MSTGQLTQMRSKFGLVRIWFLLKIAEVPQSGISAQAGVRLDASLRQTSVLRSSTFPEFPPRYFGFFGIFIYIDSLQMLS